jgi:hypothetical protein
MTFFKHKEAVVFFIDLEFIAREKKNDKTDFFLCNAKNTVSDDDKCWSI